MNEWRENGVIYKAEVSMYPKEDISDWDKSVEVLHDGRQWQSLTIGIINNLIEGLTLKLNVIRGCGVLKNFDVNN